MGKRLPGHTLKNKPFSLILSFVLAIVTSCSSNQEVLIKVTDGISLQEAIDKALSGNVEGTTIQLEEGVYRISRPLVFSEKHSGIVIKGRGMGKTVISGGVELPPFVPGEDGLWTIDLSTLMPSSGEIRQLFVNGKRAVLARTPNGGRCFPTGEVKETIIDTAWKNRPRRQGYAVQEIKLPKEAMDELKKVKDANPEQLKVEIYHCWNMTRKYVGSICQAHSSIVTGGYRSLAINPLDNVSQCRLTDDKAFLDEPGEWFYDAADAVLYYYPFPEEKIEDSRAVIPAAKQMVIIKGSEEAPVRNICFEGLSFQFTRVNMSRRGDYPQQGAYDTDACILADYGEQIQLKDCEISHTGNNGIWFREGCRDCSLISSYLHDLGVGAVKIGTSSRPSNEEKQLTRRIRVENNIIRDGGNDNQQGEGVMILHSSDNVITHNDISDFYYSGISIGWVWGYSHSPSKRNEISFNHIHHLGWGLLSDMGGVYTLGASEGTTVTGNVIHDIYSMGYGGWGIYTDEGSAWILIENNLVYNCKSSGFNQHYGKENIIRNNIFINGLKCQLESNREEDHLSYTFSNNIVSFRTGSLYGSNWGKANADVHSNLYWKEDGTVSFNGLSLEQWQTKYGKDEGSVIADPMFGNVDAGDYTIGNVEAIAKIGFKPFDWTKAGVIGKEEWKKLALYDSKRAEAFVEIEGFEPSLTEPESVVLPLHHISMCGIPFTGLQIYNSLSKLQKKCIIKLFFLSY